MFSAQACIWQIIRKLAMQVKRVDRIVIKDETNNGRVICHSNITAQERDLFY